MIVFNPEGVIKSSELNSNFAELKDGTGIDNGAITSAHFKPGSFEYRQPIGSNFSTTSTSPVAVGVSTTYTAGPTNETLYTTVTCLVTNSTNTLAVYLYVDGVAAYGGIYISSQNWVTQTKSWFIDVDAGQTVTLALYWNVGGATGQMSRSASLYTPQIKGWSFYRA